MNTTETHKAIKISSRKNNFGMNISTWTYRGVTLHYYQTTKRRAPWSATAHTKNDWFKMLGSTKAELMERIDDKIDSGRYVARTGALWVAE